MCHQTSLLTLIAPLDQQLAEAEADRKEPLTILEFTHRSENVDGFRVTLADVEWQMARTVEERIGDRGLLSDRHLSWSMPGESELCDKEGIINEFLAAPDAELTLESVLKERVRSTLQ